MGNSIRTKNGTKTQGGILTGVSKMVSKMKGDTMSDKGWKAIAIVGIWGSLAASFAVTGDMNKDVASYAAGATFIIAFFM
jgi:hypothetical protein